MYWDEKGKKIKLNLKFAKDAIVGLIDKNTKTGFETITIHNDFISNGEQSKSYVKYKEELNLNVNFLEDLNKAYRLPLDNTLCSVSSELNENDELK